jgi:hypothetical protein
VSLLHPEGFHGQGRTRRYFEGWYLKVVSADRAQRWAIIPGLFLGTDGRAEAFIQVLDGVTARTWFVPYPRDRFRAEEDRFEVEVGASRFSSAGLTLAGSELPLEGEVRFSGLTPWPVTRRSPGIMDWYAYVPFMECYHGVVSLHHRLEGELRTRGGERVSLDGGVGYVEKDWGQAFPAAYVWLHSNTFASQRACLVGSIAVIPWLATSFPGFIVGLWLDGTLHRFATYTGARSVRLAITDTEVAWELESADLRLTLTAERRRGGLLHAPVRTEMHKRVEETLDSRVHVRLVERRTGTVRFEDTGECAGLEVHGDTARLVR